MITRIFGCMAYIQIPKALRRGKTQNPNWTGIMVGYSESSPEWIILDPESGRLRNAFHVKFDENSPGWDILSQKTYSEEENTPNALQHTESLPWPLFLHL